MPVLAPLVQLSLATLKGLARALSYQSVRQWVLPILAWEAAGWFIDLFFFALKRRASEMIISRYSDEVEVSAFLAWAELEPRDLERLSRSDAEKLIDRYVDIRVTAKPGSRLAYTLQSASTGGNV